MKIPRCDIDGVGEGVEKGSHRNFKAHRQKDRERQSKTEENVDGRPVGARRKAQQGDGEISRRDTCSWTEFWREIIALL